MSVNSVLEQLDDIDIEASEKGYPIPFRPAFRSAEKLIKEFYEAYPSDIIAFPTKYGEICVDVPHEIGGFTTWIDSSGSVRVSMVLPTECTEVQFNDDENIGQCFKMFLKEAKKCEE